MKKRIMSLMACVSFFGTSPCFCMDNEEKPEKPFSILLVEQNKEKIEAPAQGGTLAFIYEAAYHFGKVWRAIRDITRPSIT